MNNQSFILKVIGIVKLLLAILTLIQLGQSGVVSASCSGMLSSQRSNLKFNRAKIEPGKSDLTFLAGGDLLQFGAKENIKGLTDGSERRLPSGAEPSTISFFNDGDDVIIQAAVNGLRSGPNRNFGFALAKIEVDESKSRVMALDPAFTRQIEGMYKDHPTDAPHGPNLQIMEENTGQFFGLQFEARADDPKTWKIVLETEETKKLSELYQKTVTLQATFSPRARRGYVTVPLGDFKYVVRGVEQPNIPPLLSNKSGMNIRSISFEVNRDSAENGRDNLNPIHADLRIYGGKIAFGAVYGARYPDVRRMLLRMADLWEESGDIMTVRSNLERASPNPNVLRGMVKLLDRMNARFYSFPALEGYRKLKTAREQVEFLNNLLKDRFENQIFTIPAEGTLPDGPALPILDDLWRTAGIRHELIRERGDFALLHGEQTHAMILAAMLYEFEDDKSIVYQFLTDRATFAFFWNLVMGDCRAGGSTDVAAWAEKFENHTPTDVSNLGIYDMGSSRSGPDTYFNMPDGSFKKSGQIAIEQAIRIGSLLKSIPNEGVAISPSGISDSILALADQSSPENPQIKLELMAQAARAIADGGIYQRKIVDQSIDGGRAVREGFRRVSFSNFISGKTFDGVRYFSMEESVQSLRSEWNLDLFTGARVDPPRLRDRETNRRTMFLFFIGSGGAIQFSTFRLGVASETLTSRGFANFKDGRLLIGAQSGLSNYPISDAVNVRGFSQSTKIIGPLELSTTAVTFVKEGDSPESPFRQFGEWDEVKSTRLDISDHK